MAKAPNDCSVIDAASPMTKALTEATDLAIHAGLRVASLIAWLVRGDEEPQMLGRIGGVASGALYMARQFREAQLTGFRTNGAC